MFPEQFQWVCISMAPNAFSFPYNFYEGLRGRRSELETNSVGHDIYRHLVGAHDKMQPQTHPPEICRRKAILTFLLFVYLCIYFYLRWVFHAMFQLFHSCGEQGLLFIAVHGLLIAVVSLVGEHGI